MRTRKYRKSVAIRALVAVFLAGGLMVQATGAGAHNHGRLTAVAELAAKSGSQVSGTLVFHEIPGVGVHITGRVSGLKPGRHGFHVHVNGNCESPDAMSAGGHYAPLGGRHGAPADQDHHLGDLGNIDADDQGIAQVDVVAQGLSITLMSSKSIAERSIVIHDREDDFSDPAGNSGPRVACGYIDLVEEHMRM